MTGARRRAGDTPQQDRQPGGRRGDGGASLPERLTVDEVAEGMRLDGFVGRRTGVSTARARRWIDAGLIRVDDHVAAKGDRLVAGSLVEIAARPEGETLVVPDPSVPVVVVYEDDALIAIDKPAGIPSHPLRAEEKGTAANGIVARFASCAGASADPREGGLGHRLDTATSGVLIAARSREAWVGLRRALGAEDCEKRYLCEVWGAPPDVGRVDAEIGRRGRRGRAVLVGGGRGPRAAQTDWRVLFRGARTAVLEARLHAGRPHQVRAHLASAGFPIVGDDRYGPVPPPKSSAVSEAERGAPPRLRLHAAAVRFRHPTTGSEVLIEAPAPSWARFADGRHPR